MASISLKPKCCFAASALYYCREAQLATLIATQRAGSGQNANKVFLASSFRCQAIEGMASWARLLASLLVLDTFFVTTFADESSIRGNAKKELTDDDGGQRPKEAINAFLLGYQNAAATVARKRESSLRSAAAAAPGTGVGISRENHSVRRALGGIGNGNDCTMYTDVMPMNIGNAFVIHTQQCIDDIPVRGSESTILVETLGDSLTRSESSPFSSTTVIVDAFVRHDTEENLIAIPDSIVSDSARSELTIVEAIQVYLNDTSFTCNPEIVTGGVWDGWMECDAYYIRRSYHMDRNEARNGNFSSLRHTYELHDIERCNGEKEGAATNRALNVVPNEQGCHEYNVWLDIFTGEVIEISDWIHGGSGEPLNLPSSSPAPSSPPSRSNEPTATSCLPSEVLNTTVGGGELTFVLHAMPRASFYVELRTFVRGNFGNFRKFADFYWINNSSQPVFIGRNQGDATDCRNEFTEETFPIPIDLYNSWVEEGGGSIPILFRATGFVRNLCPDGAVAFAFIQIQVDEDCGTFSVQPSSEPTTSTMPSISFMPTTVHEYDALPLGISDARNGQRDFQRLPSGDITWQSINDREFQYTRGNNGCSYNDSGNNNPPNCEVASRNFLDKFAKPSEGSYYSVKYNPADEPTTEANSRAATVNLFYWYVLTR